MGEPGQSRCPQVHARSGAPGEEPGRDVAWQVDITTVAAVVRDSAIVKVVGEGSR